MQTDLTAFTATIIGAHLLGTVPFGVLIARAFGEPDIRSQGSGNIGATNVWRVVGPGAAVCVYVCDIGRGALAMVIARSVEQSVIDQDLFLAVCAVAVVLGNVFPFYLKFRGGKGVSTALGAVLTVLPLETAVCVLVFSVVVAMSRFVSLGSIVAACSLCPVIVVEIFYLESPVPLTYLYFSILLGVVILVSHRENIGRLLAGTENRFSWSSQPNQTG